MKSTDDVILIIKAQILKDPIELSKLCSDFTHTFPLKLYKSSITVYLFFYIIIFTVVSSTVLEEHTAVIILIKNVANFALG